MNNEYWRKFTKLWVRLTVREHLKECHELAKRGVYVSHDLSNIHYHCFSFGVNSRWSWLWLNQIPDDIKNVYLVYEWMRSVNRTISLCYLQIEGLRQGERWWRRPGASLWVLFCWPMWPPPSLCVCSNDAEKYRFDWPWGRWKEQEGHGKWDWWRQVTKKLYFINNWMYLIAAEHCDICTWWLM